MKISDREIGNGQPTYIIAEAGTNHMGDVARACELVLEASEAGADAIKFQAFDKDEPLFCPYDGDEARIPYWNSTVLDYDEWHHVAGYAMERQIHFILSVFQHSAISLLDACDAAKVASRAAKTYPYDKVDLPLIISTGMDPAPFKYGDRENIWFLSCVAKYPTPLDEALQRMREVIGERGNRDLRRLGLSDHSGNVVPGLFGIVHNLSMLEVHFSSEKTGRDAVVELTVDELKLLCDFRDAVAL